MKFSELIEESFVVLKSNKMRTLLSILGIVIGIGSVIALMSLGQGSQKSIEERISELGSNLLIVSPGSSDSGFMRSSAGVLTTLTYNDAVALSDSKRVTTIDLVAPEYTASAQLSYNRNNMNAQVVSTTEVYPDIRNVDVEIGTFFTKSDIDNMSKVAVIGSEVVDNLFENTSPLGQMIRINGQFFRVIGVTASKGGGGMMSTDSYVYIPITTAQTSLFGKKYVTSISIKAKSLDVMEDAQNQIGYFLLERHQIDNPEDADFSIQSMEDIIDVVSEVSSTFTTLLTGIAAISLVVGGIGIMNIMLVTVTERTKEIGLRKALGAKKKTIMTQFLIEALVLTIVGGIIGLAVGIVSSYFLSKSMSIPFVIVWQSVLLAVGVSSVIGIIFGLYPARKASNLLPIEALRYE